jgi:hypothetical protein
VGLRAALVVHKAAMATILYLAQSHQQAVAVVHSALVLVAAIAAAAVVQAAERQLMLLVRVWAREALEPSTKVLSARLEQQLTRMVRVVAVALVQQAVTAHQLWVAMAARGLRLPFRARLFIMQVAVVEL